MKFLANVLAPTSSPTATYHRHRLFPSALLMAYAATSTLTTTLVNSQCTLCEDGSAVGPTLNIGSATCAVIDSAIGSSALDSSVCIDAQLEGFEL
jgi:hypothetical protein